MTNPSYRVTKLENGTVIDHIAPGRALQAVRLLKLAADTPMAIGIHFPSGKHGRKDLIKIDGVFLGAEEIAILSLFSPEATISIIRGFQVTEKLKPIVPPHIEGFLRCPNAGCITSHEKGVTTRFTATANPLLLVCLYCERSFGRDQLQLR